ncbi:hypothetical protein QE379_003115 [Sphingomonas sp. SORGH_AS 879]|nr:hypothetical protein [Sphingomonas sp. SORGH_AS_0879]
MIGRVDQFCDQYAPAREAKFTGIADAELKTNLSSLRWVYSRSAWSLYRLRDDDPHDDVVIADRAILRFIGSDRIVSALLLVMADAVPARHRRRMRPFQRADALAQWAHAAARRAGATGIRTIAFVTAGLPSSSGRGPCSATWRAIASSVVSSRCAQISGINIGFVLRVFISSAATRRLWFMPATTSLPPSRYATNRRAW